MKYFSILWVAVGLLMSSQVTQAKVTHVEKLQVNATQTDKQNIDKLPKRMIFAHYMGCFPVGTMAMAHYYRQQPKDIALKNTSFLSQVGGRFTNWPLIPHAWIMNNHTSLRQTLELEIKRAMRMGLDGFAIDAWAGANRAKTVLRLLFDIVKEKKLKFYLTICLDPNCHPIKTDRYDDSASHGGHVNGMYDTVRYLFSHYGEHPNFAHYNGKPLIFTYSTQGFQSKSMRGLGYGKDEPARWREKLIFFNNLRKMVRKEFKTEIFLHHDIDQAFLDVKLSEFKDARLPHQPGPISAKLAGYLAKGENELQGQDAVGGFLGVNWEPEFEAAAEKIKKAGKIWSIPMWHQYNNVAGSLYVKPGTDQLRQRWDLARKTDSRLIQYITWNDYGEDTNIAPGTATRYTIYDLIAHQIKWWKTGTQPVYDHDKVYLIYRRYPAGSNIYPFNARRSAEGVLEVTTILTKPATIQLPGRDAIYQAPAGLFVKQFPLSPGDVIAQVQRGGKVTLEVKSPDPISDKPWREANAMVCYSSEFERLWKLDFPDTPSETYAEYGDADEDDLPNWFEMFWFGKLGDYTTATLANPQDDPDGDGLTNLQEYQQQSNPLKKAIDYEVGHVWDLSTVHQSGATFNPDRDSTGRPVWHYLYRLGNPPIALDGKYLPCPKSVSRYIPYAGDMVQHLPYLDGCYKSVYGWIARHKNPIDHSWMIQLHPGFNSIAILAWEAPITGTVSLSFKTFARQVYLYKGQKGHKATLTIQRTNPLEILYQKQIANDQSVPVDIPEISINAGERIYIIAADQPNRADLMIEQLQIQLKALK